VTSDPRSWLDRLLAVCFMVLAGAAAISIAVHLIEAVWTSLVVIVSVGVFLVLAFVAVRARSRGW
jgi:VIT1/CCC1 family predicted Fe2+/Mn2+ transporter